MHDNHLLFKLVEEMHLIWDTNSFLDRAQELVKKAFDEHANYNTAELDRSRPSKKKQQEEDDSVNRYESTCTQWAQVSSEK